MSKNVLLVGGCSYTDKNFTTSAPDFKMPDKTWPMWPEYLASSFGMEHINVARCGYDNFSIFQTVLKSIVLNEKRIGAVVVLWSGWDRSLLFNMFPFVTLNSFNSIIEKKESWTLPQFLVESKLNEGFYDYLNSKWWDGPSFLRDSVNNTLSLMYTLATICESKGIKYLFYQGVAPMEYGALNYIVKLSGKISNINEKEIFDEIRKCPYSGELEKRKSKILGWPFLSTCGGHFLDHIRYRNRDIFPDLMKVSNLDFHPNADAQPIIANLFYDAWKKIYE